MKTKLELRILMYENFMKDTVYLGIRLLRFFGMSFAIRIPIPFYHQIERILKKR